MAATVRAEPTFESERVQAVDRRRTNRWIVDAVLAVGLFIVALRFRWHFPPDGLFYDDAWQAFGAIEGSFRQLFTVGQTQPGFGFELIVWHRMFGSSAATMVTPVLLAGALGPPALYLTLRKFRYAVSISFLLGAALAVCETAIEYSGHVKSYTADVLVILLLCVLLPWLARRRWSVAIAVAWFAGSVLVASFSSFALLASIAAGAILVFHPHGDRRLRIFGVGAQALGLLVLFLVEDRTHNAGLLNGFFKASESYLQFHLNPLTFGGEIIKHLVRVTEIFPGGPGWLNLVCMVAAVVGLAAMARRGSRSLVGRFLVLMIVLAMIGAFAGRVPFGPTAATSRVTLWLAPVVAFGLATVLQRAYRAAEARGTGSRLAFDAVVLGLSVLLLVSAIGARRPYAAAGALAAQQAMAEAGPQDVILITRPEQYTFALEAGAKVNLRPTPHLIIGLAPHFKDKRLHPIDTWSAAARKEIVSALKNTNRAFVVDSTVGQADYKKYRADLASLIAAQGFRQQPGPTKVGTGRVTVWLRRDAPPPPG
jgi:hypothetical protein